MSTVLERGNSGTVVVFAHFENIFMKYIVAVFV
jgi:hypothetical protein